MLRRISFFSLFAILFSVWLGGTAPAYAQNQHAGHYKAYNQALDNGDFSAAADHAEAAWRAAEEELGDHQTTAILAYNYANLIYYSRPADAIAPLTRVIDLTGESADLFGADEPILMLLFVQAAADDQSAAPKKALRKRLDERETAGAPPSLIAARAWAYLALFDLGRKRYERVAQSADLSIKNYKQAAPDRTRELTAALIAGGVARIAGRRSRNNQDLIEAAQLFDEAIALFPAQVSIESFDSLLAAAITWRVATIAAVKSDNPEYGDIRSRIARDAPNLDSTWNVKWVKPTQQTYACLLRWDEREPPKFPQSDANKGYIGAVLAGYHIDESGQVTGARILAEVPQKSKFGEVALKSMAGWTLAEPLPAACRQNRLTVFQFTIL